MFCAGSGVERCSTGSWSNCMNTRFQYSRKRSLSPPGRSSALAERPARGRGRAPSTGRTGRSARPARSSPSAGSATIRSRGTPIASHASIASSSGPRPSSSSPSKTVTQMSLGVEAEALERQLPGELDGALLEVVADREVAEHLEEREVARGGADVVDVGACGSTSGSVVSRWCGGFSLAQEVRLERVHARGGEQHRRVVRGGHERRRRQALVVALLEEAQEALADLVGGHTGSVWTSRPRAIGSRASPASTAVTDMNAQPEAERVDRVARRRRPDDRHQDGEAERGADLAEHRLHADAGRRAGRAQRGGRGAVKRREHQPDAGAGEDLPGQDRGQVGGLGRRRA